MDRKEIDFILQEGEGLKIEFKEKLSNLDKDFKFNDSFFVTLHDKTKLVEKVGVKVGEKLTKNQEKIINFILKNRNISAKELSEKVGISSRKIEENISKLKKKGIIKRIGPARGGYWEIVKG